MDDGNDALELEPFIALKVQDGRECVGRVKVRIIGVKR
jgi:hypothetical protein